MVNLFEWINITDIRFVSNYRFWVFFEYFLISHVICLNGIDVWISFNDLLLDRLLSMYVWYSVEVQLGDLVFMLVVVSTCLI